jgi:hypothetical protein
LQLLEVFVLKMDIEGTTAGTAETLKDYLLMDEKFERDAEIRCLHLLR